MQWRETRNYYDDEWRLNRIYQDQESAIEHLRELSKEYHREWMSKRKKVDDYREKHFFERFDAVEDGRPFMSLMNRTEGTGSNLACQETANAELLAVEIHLDFDMYVTPLLE